MGSFAVKKTDNKSCYMVDDLSHKISQILHPTCYSLHFCTKDIGDVSTRVFPNALFSYSPLSSSLSSISFSCQADTKSFLLIFKQEWSLVFPLAFAASFGLNCMDVVQIDITAVRCKEGK